ncbi:hypothetical protein Ddye_012959, partial [Dipteronia dyeriana]
NFVKKYIGPDNLSMVKTSIRGNSSQLYIYNTKTEWLDGKQVVFDQVVEGFDVLKAFDKIGSSFFITSNPVLVVDCGELC